MPLGEWRLLARRYRLVSQIGRGGMGTVWRAHDEVLDRYVAIKEVVCPPGLGDDDRRVLHRRTLREARSAARLTHPSIVTVHDVVEQDGRPWIVMELLAAPSLQDVIDRDGPLPPRRVTAIGRQVLAALRVAHAAGILHRDVKPGNVLLVSDSGAERAVLTDFGLATKEGDATLTQVGLVMGSPAYISPERAMGERASPAADLWALGALLYAACEGRPPHDRSDALTTLAAVLNDEPPRPRGSGPLPRAIAGLLVKDPGRRMTADMADVLLAQAARETAPEATPATTPEAASATTSKTAPSQNAPAQKASFKDVPPGAPVRDPRTVTAPLRAAPDGGWRGRLSRMRSRLGLLVGLTALVAVVGIHAFVLLLGDDRESTGRQAGATSQVRATAESPTVIPTDFRAVSGSGYTLAVPTGWRRKLDGNSVIYIDGEDRYVQIDTTPWPGSALEHARMMHKKAPVEGRLPGYQLIEIRAVHGVPYEAADWEFTYTSRNVRRHGFNRQIVSDSGRQYVVFIVAAESELHSSRRYVDTILSSFRLTSD